MDIRLRRTIPCELTGPVLDVRLGLWSFQMGFSLTERSSSRYVFERGLRGWRLAFASANQIFTEVIVEQAPGRIECSLSYRSPFHMETPRWFVDDRAPLEALLDELEIALGCDKCELDVLLNQIGRWEEVASQ